MPLQVLTTKLKPDLGTLIVASNSKGIASEEEAAWYEAPVKLS